MNKRFWILDFGFWIEALIACRTTHRRSQRSDDNYGDCAGESWHQSANPQSKIQNPKSTTLAAFIALTLAAAAYPDTIIFSGTGVSLRGCTIQSIQGGQVLYLDASNARQRRPLNQVDALGFDGLPELDQAETAIAQEDFDTGVRALLRAMLAAQTDQQKLWLHARLARVHDLRGEYVQAAGHAAAVFLRSEDLYWKDLRPVSPVNQPSYPAAKEAFDNLQAAARKVKSGELKGETEVMLRTIRPIHEQLAQSWTGEAVAANSTFSGLTKEEILGEAERATKPAETAPVASDSAKPPVAPPTARSGDNGPQSPEAIENLLAAGRSAEALALCQQIEKDPGARDLARYLYQYGRALSQTGNKRDAAVMLTRCAILHPDSEDAGPALIETAIIYRAEFRKPEVGRRLLQRVLADAERDGRTTTAMLARELLDKWTPQN
jgi:tetratricopeptide (TPR) repeat protein